MTVSTVGNVPETVKTQRKKGMLAFGKMVGAVRFELTTSCTRNKRATRLRYAPTLVFTDALSYHSS